MKRALGGATLAAAFATLVLVPSHVACGRSDVECSEAAMPPRIDVSSSGSSAGVTWTSDGASLAVSNGRLTLRWDEKSGSLIGLTNAATGTQLLPTDAHASLAAMVNGSTASVWSAADTAWSMMPILQGIALRTIATGVTVDLTFHVAPCSAVTAVQHATLETASPVSSWTTDLSVPANANAVALAIRSPRVAGIGLPQTETLAWPWHEGALFERPGDAQQTLEYPVPASMQWASLYDAHEGLYVGVLNAAVTRLEQLYYGRDPADLGAGRELSMAFWPYVTRGQTWTTPVVEVGVSDDTGWYWGAERYRAWLLRAGMYKQAHAPFFETMAGWHKSYDWITDGAGPRYSYCDVPTTLMPETFSSQYGLSTLVMYGWSYLGLDHDYPDYDWLAGPDAGAGSDPCLGESGLAAAVQALHARTPRNDVLFYLNARSADPRGSWYPPHRENVRAKMLGGGAYALDGYEPLHDGGYANHLDLVCPAAQAWIEQLASRAAALRALDAPTGADGIYWDQIAELPAHPCYDPSHGHANPRSAGVEGIPRLLARLQSDFAGQAGATGFVFTGEGVNDTFAQYMDIASPPPQRYLGYVPAHCDDAGAGSDLACGATYAPQIARYVLPIRILGLPTQVSATTGGGSDTTQSAYAWAFVLGEPIRSKEYSADPTPNAFALPRYPKIYALEPTIYFDGRFLDQKGLTVTGIDALTPFDVNPPVVASVILGARNDRVGVQLWNNSGADVSLTVSVDLAALGVAGSSASAVVDIEGVLPPLAFANSGSVVTFVVPVAANDVQAIKIVSTGPHASN